MNKILLLITSEPDKKIALNVGRLLIKKKLAACISLKEIISIYNWKGEIEQVKEFQIIVKSTPSHLNKIIDLLKKQLKNELPQIIYNIFDSDINYFNWVDKNVK